VLVNMSKCRGKIINNYLSFTLRNPKSNRGTPELSTATILLDRSAEISLNLPVGREFIFGENDSHVPGVDTSR